MEGEDPAEVVVDASVVAKWFIAEKGREKAVKLRDDYVDGKVRLHAPALMPFEVLNAVRFSRRDVKADVLKAVAESLALYGIQLHQLSGRYAELVVEVALENGITIYDASYVALAKYLGAVLYTADQKLIESLNSEYRVLVKSIGEYGETLG
ncbi:MAG: type II toxin-antitoxin system VapC family toxin [Thermofilum sp.]